jgi:hypothetical protein
MQEHFLFDSDDAKQRGKGCDKLGSKKDGLSLRWSWKKYPKAKNRPNQCCYAELGKGWSLEVIFWHSNYEAQVRHVGEHIRSFRKDRGDTYPGTILVTRLQAQFKAESLLLDVWDELNDLIHKKGIFVNKVVRALKTGKKEVA